MHDYAHAKLHFLYLPFQLTKLTDMKNKDLEMFNHELTADVISNLCNYQRVPVGNVFCRPEVSKSVLFSCSAACTLSRKQGAPGVTGARRATL